MAKKEPGHKWLTHCPRRGDVSPMRCFQYQKRDRCETGCKQAATPHDVSVLMSLRNDVMADVEDIVPIRRKTGSTQVPA